MKTSWPGLFDSWRLAVSDLSCDVEILCSHQTLFSAWLEMKEGPVEWWWLLLPDTCHVNPILTSHCSIWYLGRLSPWSVITTRPSPGIFDKEGFVPDLGWMCLINQANICTARPGQARQLTLCLPPSLDTGERREDITHWLTVSNYRDVSPLIFSPSHQIFHLRQRQRERLHLLQSEVIRAAVEIGQCSGTLTIVRPYITHISYTPDPTPTPTRST